MPRLQLDILVTPEIWSLEILCFFFQVSPFRKKKQDKTDRDIYLKVKSRTLQKANKTIFTTICNGKSIENNGKLYEF